MKSPVTVERRGRHPLNKADLVWFNGQVSASDEKRRRVAIFAGGRCCGPASAGGLLKDVVRMSAQDRQPLTVVTCSEPYVGTRAYAASHREEFLANTLDMVAKHTDAPPLLIGHSWNGPVAVRMAAARPAGEVGGLVCLTSMGLTPWAPNIDEASRAEANYGRRFAFRPDTYVANASLALRAGSHWAGNRAASDRAVKEICESNVIDIAVALSTTMPTAAVFARYDTIAGDGSDLRATDFMGKIFVARTSHLGAIIERSRMVTPLHQAIAHVAFTGQHQET